MIMDIANPIGMETYMNAAKNDTCLLHTVMENRVEDVEMKVDNCIRQSLFYWCVGGLSSVFVCILILLFTTISDVNNNVNKLRYDVTDRMARIETRIDLIQPMIKK
jgi:hypothetical protein